jgi:hypothetical protein
LWTTHPLSKRSWGEIKTAIENGCESEDEGYQYLKIQNQKVAVPKIR